MTISPLISSARTSSGRFSKSSTVLGGFSSRIMLVTYHKLDRLSFQAFSHLPDALRQRMDQFEAQLQNQKPARQDPVGHDPVNVIQKAVARHWGVRVEDLKSPIRKRSFSLPRQVAIYLVRNQLGISFTEIGQPLDR